MSSKEKLKCRKVPCVLQFYVPNQQIQPEDYAHHMLLEVKMTSNLVISQHILLN